MPGIDPLQPLLIPVLTAFHKQMSELLYDPAHVALADLQSTRNGRCIRACEIRIEDLLLLERRLACRAVSCRWCHKVTGSLSHPPSTSFAAPTGTSGSLREWQDGGPSPYIGFSRRSPGEPDFVPADRPRGPGSGRRYLFAKPLPSEGMEAYSAATPRRRPPPRPKKPRHLGKVPGPQSGPRVPRGQFSHSNLLDARICGGRGRIGMIRGTTMGQSHPERAKRPICKGRNPGPG
jgi:hypothetical protein